MVLCFRKSEHTVLLKPCLTSLNKSSQIRSTDQQDICLVKWTFEAFLSPCLTYSAELWTSVRDTTNNCLYSDQFWHHKYWVVVSWMNELCSWLLPKWKFSFLNTLMSSHEENGNDKWAWLWQKHSSQEQLSLWSIIAQRSTLRHQNPYVYNHVLSSPCVVHLLWNV